MLDAKIFLCYLGLWILPLPANAGADVTRNVTQRKAAYVFYVLSSDLGVHMYSWYAELSHLPSNFKILSLVHSSPLY